MSNMKNMGMDKAAEGAEGPWNGVLLWKATCRPYTAVARCAVQFWFKSLV